MITISRKNLPLIFEQNPLIGPPLDLEYKSFVFNGGEVSVKLNDSYGFFDPDLGSDIDITARISNSEDFMKLAMLKDAIERRLEAPADFNLFLPYVSYGRQDRPMVKGESFSLKVFANMVNALGFNKVVTLDPHSDVTPALIDNVKVISQSDIIHKWMDFTMRLGSTMLVSPDSGANKKTAKIAGYLNHWEFARADKLRDLSTGQILETVVYKEDFNKQDVAIIDDICDGGKTFTELAQVLKKKNCGKVILYVTHGIFSKGLEVLFKEGIDEIWTTDSFVNKFWEDPRIKVFKIDNLKVFSN